MKIAFDIKLTPKDLFGFNMYQTYRSTQGPVSVILAILVMVIAGVSFSKGEIGYGILYVAVSILFLLYIPGTLWSRAKLTMKKNEVLAGTLHYEISEEGIAVSQGEDQGLLAWDQVYKLVSNKNQVLIYSNRVNAYIIPRTQIPGQYEDLRVLAYEKLEKFRVRMK